jgi:hypothetical protein
MLRVGLWSPRRLPTPEKEPRTLNDVTAGFGQRGKNTRQARREVGADPVANFDAYPRAERLRPADWLGR